MALSGIGPRTGWAGLLILTIPVTAAPEMSSRKQVLHARRRRVSHQVILLCMSSRKEQAVGRRSGRSTQCFPSTVCSSGLRAECRPSWCRRVQRRAGHRFTRERDQTSHGAGGKNSYEKTVHRDCPFELGHCHWHKRVETPVAIDGILLFMRQAKLNSYIHQLILEGHSAKTANHHTQTKHRFTLPQVR